MDQITRTQVSLAKQAKALFESYNNLPEERRTVKLVQEKLEKLEELWNLFEMNDDQLRQDFGDRKDHFYFTEDLHKQMKNLVEDFKNKLNTKLLQLRSPAPSTSAAPSLTVIGNHKEATSPSAKEIQKLASNEDGSIREPKGSINDKELHTLIRKIQMKLTSLQFIMDTIIIDNQSQEYYQFKKDRLCALWDEIEELNEGILSRKDHPEEVGYNTHKFYEQEIVVQDLIIKLNEKLHSSLGTVRSKEQNEQGNIHSIHSAIKLPSITIPKFDGDYLKWVQFKDMFSQMVDTQPLQNVEKMWYLKSNVSGEAEKLIRHLSVSDSNYKIAWKLLQDRYDNTRLLVTTILDKLINQPTTNSDSAKSLKAMYDTTRECVLMLENLNIKVEGVWDPIILHILCKKLDKETHTFYEQSLKAPRKLQTLDHFLQCIELRFQSFEALGSKHTINKAHQHSTKVSSFAATANIVQCTICEKPHQIFNCYKFLAMTPEEKAIQVKKLQLCTNCLRKGHFKKQCSSRGCKKCNKKHNTLLHQTLKGDPTNKQQGEPNTKIASVNISAPDDSNNDTYVFLGTALATIYNKDNQPIDCRVLLDSGSQINFVSERLQKLLRLDTKNQKINISGIGNAQVQSKDRVNLQLYSKLNHHQFTIEAQVIKEITSHQPQRFINISSWPLPSTIQLADPNFNKPQRIDVLLGAEMYGELVREGQIRIQDNLPILQNTVFGWMILGKMTRIRNTPFVGISNQQLDENLQKFWEVDDVVPNKAIDNKCEEFFNNTTMRNKEGRFVVKLPILSSTELLGESMNIALRRFLNIEKKLLGNEDLKKQYHQFLNEYLQLGHMREIDFASIPKKHYFIPHHSVLKPESSTTKLRVVFDASCKTTSNLSLNDIMMKGVKVQEDLFDILLRFRTYKYVITADIKQMYRQIKVSEDDQYLQLIIWRPSCRDKIRFYQLQTVTYGTKAAPYLATRCLKQLAEEESIRYPTAAKAITDFYVDDVITGSNTMAETIELKRQLIKMLDTAKFKLHKWASNNDKILEDIIPEEREKEKIFENEDSGYIKTLGMSWQPKRDIFTYMTTWPEKCRKITKRVVVSEAAQLFDPLGLISPIIVSAKIFIQKLWKLKVDWDQELNEELSKEWIRFRHELKVLNHLKIGRYLFKENMPMRIELHAFADASEKAYGVVVYIRSIDTTEKISTRLLTSKSRVAPVKLLTIPRLELCAAQLAAQLVKRIKNTLRIKIDQTYYWSDSQIVLSWIKRDPSTLKTYIAHKLTIIQESSKAEEWNYVATESNPADIVSRGTFPDQLINSELWFNGPLFLKLPEAQWPSRIISSIRVQEEERKASLLNCKNENINSEHPLYLIDHRNSFVHLQRTMAYVLRAIQILKYKKKELKNQMWLTTIELRTALTVIIKEIQSKAFADEINQLRTNNELKKNNRIASLCPFIDKEGILRVGGRLDNAAISYEAKHPMLLPGTDFVSKLILRHIHLQHLHAGPLAILAIARQKFWIIQGRALARATTTTCVECARSKPQLLQQLMGSLPEKRVLPACPFFQTGVDFCGPIMTHYTIRGKRPQKSYIAVFCCFSTKAVHMEIVSDLSTNGFIGALKRFMARRGFCKDLHCDNATNFVGAKNKLEELKAILESSQSQEQIIRDCSDKGVQFHFSPPRSPHFGGLWEAAVKSAKKLLTQTLSSASLTFEELSTVVAEAEAILNSRPLTPLSTSPNDYAALTPGHFLIGEPLTTIPEPEGRNNNWSALTRWKLVSAVRQEFWRRWMTEYLTELQKRSKWRKTASIDILPGMLVIMREDNTPPLKWPMGRIKEVIKGKDGLPRVAIVQTARGIYKRAIHNLAPLPIEGEEYQQNKEEVSKKHKRNTEERDTPARTKRIKTTANHTMIFIITLLFLPFIVLGYQSPFSTTAINSRAGIYFESLGQGQLAVNDWKIIVYYNMTNYWHTYSVINKGMIKMQTLAKSIVPNDYLAMITRQYEQQFYELSEGNQLLFHNITDHHRQRRGVINIVGNIANKLFGILDDEYAKEIETTIKNVKGDQDYLLKLMKNQTSIIEATANLVNKSQEDRITQIRALETELDEIFIKTKGLTEEVKRERINRSFILLVQFMSLVINEFQKMQAAIMDIIIDTHHGRPNPFILRPKQLEAHLQEIERQLPPTVRLPSTTQLYSLMTVKCKVDVEHTIFALHIPILANVELETYKLVPLPTRVNNTFVRIEPQVTYLMTNLHRDVVYTLTNIEFENCHILSPNQRICKQLRPLYTKTASHLQCEFYLLNQQRLADQCQLKITKPIKTWIQLEQRNQWLYSLDKEYIYHIVCDDKVAQIKLANSGILSFTDNCILKDDDLTIQSYKSITTTIAGTWQPMIDLPDELNTTLPEIATLKHIKIPNGAIQTEYGKLKHDIQSLITEETSFPELSIHDIHQYTISYVALALLIIITLCLYCRNKWYNKNSLRNSTRPRIQPTLSREDFQLNTVTAGEDVYTISK